VSDQRETAPRPLTVDTDLDVSVDGVPVAVTSTANRVFIDFPSIGPAIRTIRHRPVVDYRSVDGLLRAGDLALEVRVRHRTVFAFGADTRPSVLLGQLGVEPVELRVTGVLSALGAEAAAAVDRLRRIFD
jgi:hypothetical protein